MRRVRSTNRYEYCMTEIVSNKWTDIADQLDIERGWLFRRTSIDIQSFQSFAYSIETPAIMLSKSSHTPKLGSWVSESQSYSST